ncbi:Ribonuclease H domain [Dillenia turbinata]|uniref:Ribonuclease H domain n=1 Tax=Dillenia turbinata TaxID=194707 RepID=A0AAN8UJ77_9MAGN
MAFPNLIAWRHPPPEHYKLNIYGSVTSISGLAAGGGLIWDSNGKWIAGFTVNIGIASPLSVELRSIKEGLNLVSRLNLSNTLFETDSMDIVNIFNRGTPSSHPLLHTINDCMLLRRSCSSHPFSFIHKEGNQPADLLAKLGHQAPPSLHILYHPPQEIIPLLLADDLSTPFVRKAL